MNLSEYVRQHVTDLIEAVEQQSRLAATDSSEHGVHDLRVSIRRLSENLRVFEDLFPRGAAKTVRKNLRVAMHMAGEARNHDIARKLMDKARVSVPADFAKGREHAGGTLSQVLNNWNSGGAFRAWKEQLHG